jgi:hypothetical protein
LAATKKQSNKPKSTASYVKEYLRQIRRIPDDDEDAAIRMATARAKLQGRGWPKGPNSFERVIARHIAKILVAEMSPALKVAGQWDAVVADYIVGVASLSGAQRAWVRANTTIWISSTALSEIPGWSHLAGLPAPGYPGKTLDDIGAIYENNSNTVLMGRATPGNPQHGGLTLLHELGHAVDNHYALWQHPAVQAGHARMVAAGKLIPYFLQPDNVGVKEFFAEVYKDRFTAPQGVFTEWWDAQLLSDLRNGVLP